MPNKELKKLLDYCLNVKECSKCEYATEKECMLTCSSLIKECLKENYAEVVRCKDCKHYVVQRLECRYPRHNGIIGIDGFCSYGERKEE